MKRIIIIIAACMLLSSLAGCGNTMKENEEFAAWTSNLSGKGFLTEQGYYFVRDDAGYSMLYYFDIETGKTVPVCDKAECDHRGADIFAGEEQTCNAQIVGSEIVVYKNKIYYFDGVTICRRDLDGNNDEKVAVLGNVYDHYLGEAAWFYRDTLLITASTTTAKTFDAETRESDGSELILYAVNLTNGKVTEIAKSSLTDAINAFAIYKSEHGKIHFYNLELNKYFVYDLKDKTISEQKVKCTADLGEGGGYYEIVGDYCYGYGTLDGKDTLVRMNIETGEEETYYAARGSYCPTQSWFNGARYVVDLPDWEEGMDREKISFYYYDEKEGVLTELSRGIYNDYRTSSFPVIGDEKGIVYSVAVNRQEDETVYTGDVEYRYMSMENLLAGNDEYQVVYCLEEEEE